jgi:L-iditol 2-dehydrogenase
MPQECCYPVTGKLSSVQAVICEPFAIGVYSVKQSRIGKNSKIAILGVGPIGLSCMVAALAEGTSAIYITDKLDYRVEIAKKMAPSGVAIRKSRILSRQSWASSRWG